jgi:hypothetical protein
MAIDLEKLRNKLNQLKNPEKKQFNSCIWKAPSKDGEKKTIRLVQYPLGDDPFVELWFHYKIGNKSILCPRKNDGRACPICELAHSLWESKDEKELALAKTLSPTQRIYAVVLDRADATGSPMYWGFGVQIYQKLIETLVNPRTRHMMEVDSGFDITVSSNHNPKKKYRETDFSIEGADTPLCKTPEETQKFLAAIKPLREVFKPMAQSEIKKALEDWLSYGSDQAEKESSETSKGPKETVDPLADDDKKEAETSSDTVADVEDAFNTAVANAKKVK